MATTDTFTVMIARKVGADRQGLSPEDFVTPALRVYEKYRPREIVTAVTGDGTQEYALATVLTPWLVGFSRIIPPGIEYPVDETPPAYLDQNDYLVRRVANTGSNSETRVEKLYLHTIAPAATETFRVSYTARHTVNATYSTVPAEDEEAVADFGASLFLQELAVRYSGLVSQSGLMADQVIAYEGKATDARANARLAMKRGRIALGLPAEETDDASPAAAFEVVDADLTGWEGRRKLTHHSRYR